MYFELDLSSYEDGKQCFCFNTFESFKLTFTKNDKQSATNINVIF